MALPSLTLRLVKGSPLTLAEMDNNLTSLQTATIGLTVGATTKNLNLNDSFTLAAGTGTSVTLNTATNTITISNSSAVTTATSATLGSVKIGSGVNISADGTISVNALSSATSSTLGGVIIGANVNIAGDGTISVAVPGKTNVYARSALPAGSEGLIITISNSGSDSNSPAGDYAPAYWNATSNEWTYIGNSNSVTAA